jgi:predicted Zn-ribbon and HTH transcriptional regulator
LGDAKYYKCEDCGYEFLAKNASPACPRCKSSELEARDLKNLIGMDD